MDECLDSMSSSLKKKTNKQKNKQTKKHYHNIPYLFSSFMDLRPTALVLFPAIHVPFPSALQPVYGKPDNHKVRKKRRSKKAHVALNLEVLGNLSFVTRVDPDSSVRKCHLIIDFPFLLLTKPPLSPPQQHYLLHSGFHAQ